LPASWPKKNIEKGKHYVDLTQPDTFVVMNQPEGQYNAILGGIMALRMAVLGAKGVVVNGRVRDTQELGSIKEFSIFGRSTSTVGAGALSVPHALNVPLVINEITINPGDVIFADPLEGVVSIPSDLLEKVLELLPKLVSDDEKVKEAVKAGMAVQEAFEKFRT
jgi:regulator of RNase E activity RraA